MGKLLKNLMVLLFLLFIVCMSGFALADIHHTTYYGMKIGNSTGGGSVASWDVAIDYLDCADNVTMYSQTNKTISTDDDGILSADFIFNNAPSFPDVCVRLTLNDVRASDIMVVGKVMYAQTANESYYSNESNYWDNLNSPSDISITDLTDDFGLVSPSSLNSTIMLLEENDTTLLPLAEQMCWFNETTLNSTIALWIDNNTDTQLTEVQVEEFIFNNNDSANILIEDSNITQTAWTKQYIADQSFLTSYTETDPIIALILDNLLYTNSTWSGDLAGTGLSPYINVNGSIQSLISDNSITSIDNISAEINASIVGLEVNGTGITNWDSNLVFSNESLLNDTYYSILDNASLNSLIEDSNKSQTEYTIALNNSMSSYVDARDQTQDECSEITNCVPNAFSSVDEFSLVINQSIVSLEVNTSTETDPFFTPINPFIVYTNTSESYLNRTEFTTFNADIIYQNNSELNQTIAQWISNDTTVSAILTEIAFFNETTLNATIALWVDNNTDSGADLLNLINVMVFTNFTDALLNKSEFLWDANLVWFNETLNETIGIINETAGEYAKSYFDLYNGSIITNATGIDCSIITGTPDNDFCTDADTGSTGVQSYENIALLNESANFKDNVTINGNLSVGDGELALEIYTDGTDLIYGTDLINNMTTIRTNLTSCDSLDTSATGEIICGTDSGGTIENLRDVMVFTNFTDALLNESIFTEFNTHIPYMNNTDLNATIAQWISNDTTLTDSQVDDFAFNNNWSLMTLFDFSYGNLTDIPTCSGTDKLTFDGSTLSCASDEVGAGSFLGWDANLMFSNETYINNSFMQLLEGLSWLNVTNDRPDFALNSELVYQNETLLNNTYARLYDTNTFIANQTISADVHLQDENYTFYGTDLDARMGWNGSNFIIEG